MNIIPSYISDGLTPDKVQMFVRQAVTKARALNPDCVAVRGVSGLLVGTIIAYKLKIPVMVVRKQGDGSHSNKRVEGAEGYDRYIIVDDCIESGRTLQTIADEIRDHARNRNHKEPTCVGLFLYNTIWHTVSGYRD